MPYIESIWTHLTTSAPKPIIHFRCRGKSSVDGSVTKPAQIRAAIIFKRLLILSAEIWASLGATDSCDVEDDAWAIVAVENQDTITCFWMF